VPGEGWSKGVTAKLIAVTPFVVSARQIRLPHDEGAKVQGNGAPENQLERLLPILVAQQVLRGKRARPAAAQCKEVQPGLLSLPSSNVTRSPALALPVTSIHQRSCDHVRAGHVPVSCQR